MALWQRNECCLICYDATCATLNAMHHTRRKTSLCYCTKVLVQRGVCYFGPVSQAKIKPCLTLYYIASRGLCIVNLFVKDFNLSVENWKMKISMRKSTRWRVRKVDQSESVFCQGTLKALHISWLKCNPFFTEYCLCDKTFMALHIFHFYVTDDFKMGH